MVELEIKNELYVSFKGTPEEKKAVKNELSYENVIWIKAGYGKKPKKVNQSYLKGGYFLLGFLPRVIEFLEKNKIEYNLKENNIYDDLEIEDHHLEGITFKPGQEELVLNAIDKKRGLIIAPTGFGKSIVIFSIRKAFIKHKALIVVPSLDLLNQFVDEAIKYFPDTKYLGDGKNLKNTDISKCKTLIVTRASVASILDDDWSSDLEVIFVDEVHNGSSKAKKDKETNKMKGGILTSTLNELLSPIKIGFTATLPDKEENKLNIEGTFGNVIGEIDTEDAEKLGVSVVPDVFFIEPRDQMISATKYQDRKKEYIVDNTHRNRLIIAKAKEKINEGKSVIIFVIQKEHGKILSEMATRAGMDIPFLSGDTKTDEREIEKEAMRKKDRLALIVSVIFREGVNIPALDCAILADVGKGESGVIQRCGRILRAVDGKEPEIWDVLDKDKYFSEHLVNRIIIYRKKKYNIRFGG